MRYFSAIVGLSGAAIGALWLAELVQSALTLA